MTLTPENDAKTTPTAVSTNDSARRNVSLPAKMLKRAASLCCLAVVLATLVTLGARFFWIADLLANLRVQQLIAIFASLTLILLAKEFRLGCIVCVCLVIHFWVMTNALLGGNLAGNVAADQANVTLRLMSVNVLSSNQSYERVIDEIRAVDPDILAVIELSVGLQRRIDDELSSQFPHEVARGENGGNFGIGLYSKTPLTAVDVFPLNEEIRSIQADCRGLRVIATHPLPPMGRRGFESRNEHLRLLARRVNAIRNLSPEKPIAVMGDFNVTPWSPHFGDFVAASGLRRAKTGLAITPTWYARGSRFPFGLVIDHIFLSPGLHFDQYSVGRDIGSDHRSVSVRVATSR